MNLYYLLLAVGAFAMMELAATLFHCYIMHGIGWRLHQSHHTRRHSAWELNDLYAVGFSLATGLLFALGGRHASLWWIACGVTAYGLVYALMHDVLVHQRLALKWQIKNRYLKHLITAHHLHHASIAREGSVSFGFLYAPPLSKIRAQMHRHGKST